MVQESERKIGIRLESLTDMVFGLALSIGALLLALSSLTSVTTIVTNLAFFCFSFVILIYVWTRHTGILLTMPDKLKNKRSVFYLNIALLLFVCVEPYLFNVLHLNSSAAVASFASSAYAVDMGLITIILSALIYAIIRYDDNNNKSYRIPKNYRYIMDSSFLIAIIFFISALPIFWSIQVLGIPSRFFIWLVVMPFIILTKRMQRRLHPSLK